MWTIIYSTRRKVPYRALFLLALAEGLQDSSLRLTQEGPCGPLPKNDRKQCVTGCQRSLIVRGGVNNMCNLSILGFQKRCFAYIIPSGSNLWFHKTGLNFTSLVCETHRTLKLVLVSRSIILCLFWQFSVIHHCNSLSCSVLSYLLQKQSQMVLIGPN